MNVKIPLQCKIKSPPTASILDSTGVDKRRTQELSPGYCRFRVWGSENEPAKRQESVAGRRGN